MWIFYCIVEVILIIMILSALFLKEKSISPNLDRTIHYNCNRKTFNPYTQKIFTNIDMIFLKIENNTEKISQESYNAMLDIYYMGNKVEQMIKDHWNNKKIEKDYSYYIDLHYASHLLGKVIKQEQQIIKKIHMECKQMQKQCEEKVMTLHNEFLQINGKNKRKVERKIEKYYRIYNQILIMTGEIGIINIRYEQIIRQQHIQTGKRRDFIAENFGEQGRRWKERMHRRTILGKENYKMGGMLR